jgi:hypothetical protein
MCTYFDILIKMCVNAFTCAYVYIHISNMYTYHPTANANMRVTKPPTMEVDDVRRKKNYLTSSNRIVDKPPSKEDFLKSLNKR